MIEMDTWETTLAPEDAPNPDGPDAVIFASCDSVSEAVVAHAQAVELVAEALSSTVRRSQPEMR